MREAELRKKVESIKVWQRHDERAPHKPLLLLYALARLSRDRSSAIPYAELDPKLEQLLRAEVFRGSLS
jgi:putative restriction endonuclease